MLISYSYSITKAEAGKNDWHTSVVGDITHTAHIDRNGKTIQLLVVTKEGTLAKINQNSGICFQILKKQAILCGEKYLQGTKVEK